VGMAIDPAHARLFIGCRGPQRLLVMSTRDGKVLSDLPIGESVDAVKVEGDQAFASTAGGILSVQSETSPGHFAIVQSVKTGEGARTMGVDAATHKIYLPSATYAVGANGKRSPVPGSFVILVVARQGGK